MKLTSAKNRANTSTVKEMKAKYRIDLLGSAGDRTQILGRKKVFYLRITALVQSIPR